MNSEFLYERIRIADRRGEKNKAILRTPSIHCSLIDDILY